jgi:hypothetical protein
MVRVKPVTTELKPVGRDARTGSGLVGMQWLA